MRPLLWLARACRESGTLTVDNGIVTKETTPCTGDALVLDHRSRVPPVLETVSLVVGTTAGGDDDTENDESGDSDDLDRGEPELALAEDARTHKVDDTNQGKADTNPKSVGILRRPEVDQNCTSHELDRENNNPVVPVVPAHGEREGLVDETLSELDVSTGDRKVGNHLTQRDHDEQTDQPNCAVTHEETERATIPEGTTGTEEETST
jgi:hypothetical protein